MRKSTLMIFERTSIILGKNDGHPDSDEKIALKMRARKEVDARDIC